MSISGGVDGLELLADDVDFAFIARDTFDDAGDQGAEFRDLGGQTVQTLVLLVEAPLEILEIPVVLVEALFDVPVLVVETLVHGVDDQHLQDGDEGGDGAGDAADDACVVFQPGPHGVLLGSVCADIVSRVAEPRRGAAKYEESLNGATELG